MLEAMLPELTRQNLKTSKNAAGKPEAFRTEGGKAALLALTACASPLRAVWLRCLLQT